MPSEESLLARSSARLEQRRGRVSHPCDVRRIGERESMKDETRQPKQGDIIVGTERENGFAVGQFPVSAQLTLRRYEAAMELARRFAELHHVDIWQSEEGSYTLLRSHRRGGWRSS